MKIEGLFQGQATAFLDGVQEEVEFGGDWKPDTDQILAIDEPSEASVITDAITADPMSPPDIEAGLQLRGNQSIVHRYADWWEHKGAASVVVSSTDAFPAPFSYAGWQYIQGIDRLGLHAG